MRIGIPAQTGQSLVAATPATLPRLRRLGYDVVVQAEAGSQARFPDAAYVEAGATIDDADAVWASDVVAATTAPDAAQVAALRPGALLVTMLAPAHRAGLLDALAERGVTALALDAVPRISRAQSIDALSALSNVAGYRAVIEAASEYGGMFAPQVTAAGSTAPARVFVIGAGVAGLAAIGTAGSLGADVRAFDVRPEVAEQIESLGATYARADGAEQEVSADGYARELTAAQERAAAAVYARETANADVVVTTALVRGRAPRTITAEMVAGMRPGSVIVDVAATGGGNCELTVPGQRVVTPGGVVVLGWTDLAGRMPAHSSQLYGTTVVNLLTLLTPDADGTWRLDPDDAVQRGMTVTDGGRVTWPPPPVAVSAGVAAPPARPAPLVAAAVPPAPGEPGAGPPGSSPAPPRAPSVPDDGELRRRRARRTVTGALAATLVMLGLSFAPTSVLAQVTVLVLAVIVGFYVISNVSHALHTPLMSQTNAISAIILVGAIVQIGSSSWVVTTLAVVAAAAASINVVGGFAVTYRMLGMFTKGR
ncbi:NAD(P) transhydrogenase, alpha subunit [Beutenbergia cavernae DSM 12333]|uniref:proton-translocating NAD(P)(+) transhydrogenase n=1 Tax=Beutenbergia cavernae (strain ATCC BAA-8 / DSM 12333 / CCUG 43141 / JCM 11478 / NBRC 16432 / NCIMB 13614 / HKI 0122) TaxID=471853 RepID=C5BYC8_BEUC1|nr:Re/Si-specific NAD(P)(+) transhydrogenase subunit alpha [Beutenbergia cavernae]ACQ81028.1 NAD(P) transhydrogenase, alpha subunit [Beutenbergia cavernae DSM 12333]